MKKMIYGRATGIAMLLIGLMFALLGYYMIVETGTIFVMLFSAPVLILWGLAFMFFPGTNKTMEEVNGSHSFKELMKNTELRKERQARQYSIITEAPKSHKIAWGISAAIGAVITLVLIVQTGI